MNFRHEEVLCKCVITRSLRTFADAFLVMLNFSGVSTRLTLQATCTCEYSMCWFTAIFVVDIIYRPVDLVVHDILSVQEVWGSITGPVKSDTVSSTTHSRCDVSSKLYRPGAEPRKRIPPIATSFGVIPRV